MEMRTRQIASAAASGLSLATAATLTILALYTDDWTLLKAGDVLLLFVGLAPVALSILSSGLMWTTHHASIETHPSLSSRQYWSRHPSREMRRLRRRAIRAFRAILIFCVHIAPLAAATLAMLRFSAVHSGSIWLCHFAALAWLLVANWCVPAAVLWIHPAVALARAKRGAWARGARAASAACLFLALAVGLGLAGLDGPEQGARISRLLLPSLQVEGYLSPAPGQGGGDDSAGQGPFVQPEPLSLAGRDLQGARLVGLRLPGAALEGTDLRGADLRNSDLSLLTSTNLQGDDASCEDPKLGPRLRLAGADMRGATLISADLRCADLVGANLEGANLEDALLAEANLSHANMRRTRLNGAQMNRAWLVSAILEDSLLDGAALDSATLDHASLLNARATAANLSRASLRGTRTRGLDLKGAFLIGTDLEGSDVDGKTLESALVLRQNQLKESNVRSVFEARLELTCSSPPVNRALLRGLPDYTPREADARAWALAEEKQQEIETKLRLLCQDASPDIPVSSHCEECRERTRAQVR